MTPRATRCTAPRLPERLLNWFLPPGDRYAATGDLNEEYSTVVRPARGKWKADLWYWKQVLMSITPTLRRRWRRRTTHPPHRRPRRGELMVHGIWQDLRFASRSLLARKGFTALAVLTLALGIGTNTAIFSVINPFLFRPMPFDDAHRLVHLFGVAQDYEGFGGDMARMSDADFADFRSEGESFAQLGAYSYSVVNIIGDGEPDQTTAGYLTDDMFNILGVRAELGRGIVPGDGAPGSARVVVLSNGLWRRNFGGDPAILGRDIIIDQNPYRVIGVMPADFNFPFGGVRMWIPRNIDPTADRDRRYLLGVGRLKAEAGLDGAQAELSTIARRLATEYPTSNENIGVNVVGLRKGLIFFFDIVRVGLLTLAAAVGLVLLIACANVANLLLARASSRGREIAVRTALGAGRWRIVRQLLSESALLAGIAVVLGTALAVVAVRPIAAAMPGDLWRVGDIAVDATALVFAVLASLTSVFLSGLAPALHASRTDLTSALKQGGRSGTDGARTRRLTNLLVVGELSMAMVLLMGAALLIKSVDTMRNMDLGLTPDGVVAAAVNLPRADYQGSNEITAFFSTVTERLSRAPSIAAAAVVVPLPMDFATYTREFALDGVGEPDQTYAAGAYWVSPDYFRVMRIPVLSGRTFTSRDDATAPPVVMVNKAMAERFWPNDDPVGKRLRFDLNTDNPGEATVVGVTNNVVQGGLYQEFGPQIYTPFLQHPTRVAHVVVLAKADPTVTIPALRNAVWERDPSLPIGSLRTMNDVVSTALGPFRGIAVVLALLAVGALILAGGGIYGVISFSVSKRVNEFGIRTALGASGRDVVALVLKDGAKLTAVGVGLGVAVAFAASQLLASLLFGIGGADAVTFVLIPAFLASISLLACFIPARRATRVDPMEALRVD
ncbi:MAG: ADOP family duplicated permease [Gemmatimonadetes bacterium]|nr:ADOP family duplicated permease [Gemmatimonadota bacterium]